MPRQFRILSEEIVYQDQYRTFKKLAIARDGVPGTYTYLSGKKVVVVVPLSPTGRTPIIQQFRFPLNKAKWELCAGTLDPGETWEVAAKRELQEEMGIAAKDLIQIGRGYLSSGDSDTEIYFYLTHVSDADLNGLKAPEKMDEILDLKIVTLDDLDDMSARGDLECGLAFMALYHLHRYLKAHPHG